MRSRFVGSGAAIGVVTLVLFVGCSDGPSAPVTSQRQADTGGCALPSLVCGSDCRDLTSDRANCGACEHACGAGQVCSRGACATSCATGLTRCAADGTCHDLASDPSNCGACGNTCGTGQVCVRGACASACDGALTACGSGACRDLATDPFNCGACGRVCPAGEACTSGACALPAVCALGTSTSTSAVVDQSELVASSSTAARVGTTAATSAGQSFTVGRTGFLSGFEASLTTCGGALTSASTIQLALRDEWGQTLATAALAASAVSNGTCPRSPSSLSATSRGAAVFSFGSNCVPVFAGQRLRVAITSNGATTSGTCPSGSGTRYCTNVPTTPCTSNSQCANLPAIVSAGLNPTSLYAGGRYLNGDVAVTGASLAFKTYVTPHVINCAGLTACTGVCRDLTADRANCGRCGTACSSSQVCSAGACQAACGAGLATCARSGVSYCADLRSDNQNCGACGNACAPGQVCAAGGCVTTCGAGGTSCGRGATAYCASVANDNANCGRCGVACPAGSVCAGGVCATSCGGATTRCGDACVDLRNDPANCGACGSACAAGQVCSDGMCGLACGPDRARCGTGPLLRCVDVATDPANCGACGRACPAGTLCSAGACGVACGPGALRCDLGAGPYCAHVETDNTNCGGCGVACGAGSACVAGRCEATCGPLLRACDGVCRDLVHDPANCGVCGRACGAGEVCSGAVCTTRCDEGDTLCGGRCVDLAHDPDHCAACETSCPPPMANAIRACGEATCGTFCVAGYADCDAIGATGCETDLRTSTANCGACGRACALPHASANGCVMGACRVVSCDAGWSDCDGDPSNGCELAVGGACPIATPCGEAVVACFEGRPVCQVTSLREAGTPCRASRGACDITETCNGWSPVCDDDRVAPRGTVCRPQAAPCDVAEVCDGLSYTCIADAVAMAAVCPSALVGAGSSAAGAAPPPCIAEYTFRVEAGQSYTISTCGAFSGDTYLRVTGDCVCENDDSCGLGSMCRCTASTSGMATVCASSYPGASSTWQYAVTSSNGFCGQPTVCRPAAHACDAPEYCMGTGYECPADAARPEGATCDDGNACTTGEACSAGRCVAAGAVTCAEGGCNGASCDPATGRCIAKSDGTVCDDGDPATTADVCFEGACRGYGAAPVEVSAGGFHGLVRAADGSLWAFGDRLRGDSLAPPRVRGAATPARVVGLPSMARVAAGGRHVLALSRMGQVYTWGSNDAGQLGDGTFTTRESPSARMIAGVTRIAAGYDFSLALTSSGQLLAWGDGRDGQLGTGRPNTEPSPVTVSSVPPLTEIAAGEAHALGLDASGVVWAWGSNRQGELGRAIVAETLNAPAPVDGLPTVRAVAAGSGFSVALATDGTVWTWGDNRGGQLGDGTAASRATPRAVPGLAGVTAVAAGAQHVLALTSDGAVWGWGESGLGQLPAPPADAGDTRVRTPTAIPSLPPAQAIAAGSGQSFVVSTDGRVWGLGNTWLGALGDDTAEYAARARPEALVGFGRYGSLVIEQAYDTRRTGANTRETRLNAANVASSQFGRLFSLPVEGQVHAQPLFVGGAIHARDVLYVVTESNHAYAFYADAPEAPIWDRFVGVPFNQDAPRAGFVPCSSSIKPTAGITSTPALDLRTQTLYFVAKREDPSRPSATSPSNEAAFFLYAVDMQTGADRAGSPVRIDATISGTDIGATDREAGPTSSSASIVFAPRYHFQRPALLLQDGQIWIAFGGTCDINPYHGWVMTYDASTLAQTGAWVSSREGDPTCVASMTSCPPGSSGDPQNRNCCAAGGGIWQGGRGPASTGTGDVFVSTGNTFVVHAPPTSPSMTIAQMTAMDMSNAIVRLGRGATGDVEVHDWYVPWNWHVMDNNDLDLSSAGPTLVPGTHLLLTTGKSAEVIALDANHLGHYVSVPGCEATPPTSCPLGPIAEPGVFDRFSFPDQRACSYVGTAHGGTVVWNDRVFLWPEQLDLQSWAFHRDSGRFDCPGTYTPGSATSWACNTNLDRTCAGVAATGSSQYGVHRSTLALSANGATPGSSVLWATAPSCLGTLLAYDPTNLAAGPIFSSTTRDEDRMGAYAAFSVPTVANGRVYVPTQPGEVPSTSGADFTLVPRGAEITVYGMLPSPRTSPATPSLCACPTAPPPAVAPTWGELYTSYFDGCRTCHASGDRPFFRDVTAGDDPCAAESAPPARLFHCRLRTMGYIDPGAPLENQGLLRQYPNIPEGRLGSPLKWVRMGARMPPTGAACNPSAVAEITAWFLATNGVYEARP